MDQSRRLGRSSDDSSALLHLNIGLDHGLVWLMLGYRLRLSWVWVETSSVALPHRLRAALELNGVKPAPGGIIVDGGNFDWEAFPKRQPALNTPDPSYQGAVWVEAVKPLGPVAYIIKARTTLPRDIGSALSPFNAFQIIQGLETLPLRIERHVQNTQSVADFLAKRPEVVRVIHPSKQSGVQRARADKYLRGKYGGLVGFELAGGREAGRKLIDALQLFYHVANIGDARSLAIHPATTTHSQLSTEDQLATGVSSGYVRLSVGIEHIDDIIADLERGLGAAGGLASAA
jgi:O-acetylhomoserine (thiol)-lyase